MKGIIAETYLENRLRIRPLGVVSKKLIGLRKIAYAILSCSFREAYTASQLTIGSAISAKHPCSLQSRSKRACTGPSCTYANALKALVHPRRLCRRRCTVYLKGGRLTSIEQKIHRISVCRTTSAALPMPKAK